MDSIFDQILNPIVDALAGGDIYTVEASVSSAFNNETRTWTTGVEPESFTSASERADYLNQSGSSGYFDRTHYEVAVYQSPFDE